MTGIALIIGIIVVILLLSFTAIANFSTIICIVFAVVFWGSIAISLITCLGGIVFSIIEQDSEVFLEALRIAGSFIFFGIIISFIILIIAVFIDFFRSIASIIGTTDVDEIEFRHLFFPWERF